MAVNKRPIKKANHGRRPCCGKVRRARTRIKTPR
jgi:hypothetical protein